MWLKNLLGFDESIEAIYQNITLKNGRLKSKVNKKEYDYGKLEILSLKELRKRIQNNNIVKDKLKLRVLQADVKELHLDSNNANALFQVASQFNLLEMIGPTVTPEHGIERYEHDNTQGPICAISAGAGTIYRNYFLEIDGMCGQNSIRQIDCLSKIGRVLGNEKNKLWEMKNGYALLKEEGLTNINKKLKNLDNVEIDYLKELLEIGIQWDTQVTLNEKKHHITQAYCSALPVSYVGFNIGLWKPFASLILEASYEATFCTGILNTLDYGNNTIYLTLLGGGAFGNELVWILAAIEKAVLKYQEYALDVVIVNYGEIHHEVLELISRYNKQ